MNFPFWTLNSTGVPPKTLRRPPPISGAAARGIPAFGDLAPNCLSSPPVAAAPEKERDFTVQRSPSLAPPTGLLIGEGLFDLGKQAIEFDRLGIEIVAAGGERLLAVAGHCVRT